MDTFDSAKDHLRAVADAGNLTLFCGAGISMIYPTMAPSWWDIYFALTTELKETIKSAAPDIYDKIDLTALTQDLNTQEMANYVIQRFGGHRIGELLRVVDLGEPNSAHVSIAQLLGMDRLRFAVTTNFDTMIERAAQYVGAVVDVATPAHVNTTLTGTTQLVKLHGTTVETASLLESSWDKFAPVDPQLDRYFKNKLRGSTLLVVGYSGSDIDCRTTARFFEQAVLAGCDIFWLCRSDKAPSLPKHVAARTVFLLGELPVVLHQLLPDGAPPEFPRRPPDRAPRNVLAQAATAWCHHETAGPFSALVLFLSLAERQNTPRSIELRDSLLVHASRLAERYTLGTEIPPDGTTIANFLRFSGLAAMRAANPDAAKKMLRTSVNILGAFYDLYAKFDLEGTAELGLMLPAGYINYGIAASLTQDDEEAEASFLHAMHYARTHAGPNELISAILNMYLHVAYPACNLFDIDYVDRLVAIATRLGSIHLACELYVLKGVLLIDRNEIWSAQRAFNLSRSLAVAMFADNYIMAADTKLAECWIRSGQIERGLTKLASLYEGKRFMVFPAPWRATNSYLAGLGVAGAERYSIGLQQSAVASETARIIGELEIAATERRLPFEGRPIAIQGALVSKADHGWVLCEIGLHDLRGETAEAIALSLLLAADLIDMRLLFEARLVLENLLCRDHLDAQTRRRAEADLAMVHAHLGDFGEASTLFRTGLVDAGMLPDNRAMEFLIDGTWCFAQGGALGEAKVWANAVLKMLETHPQYRVDVAWERGALEKASEHFFPIVDILAAGALPDDNKIAVEAEIRRTVHPRRFDIALHESVFHANHRAVQMLHDVERLMESGQHDTARETIDSVEKMEALSEHEIGSIAILRAKFLSVVQGATPQFEDYVAQLEIHYAPRRKFSVLADVELARQFHLARTGQTDRLLVALTGLPVYEMMARNPHTKDLFGVLRSQIQADDQASSEGQEAHQRQMAAQGGYFGTAPVFGGMPEAAAGHPSFDMMQAVKTFIDELMESDSETYPRFLAERVRYHRKAADLDWRLFGALVDAVAHASLCGGDAAGAERYYLRAKRLFRCAGDIAGEHLARMGRARAVSMGGDHVRAISLFLAELHDAADTKVKGQIHNAIGTTYARLGLSGSGTSSTDALNNALSNYELAVALQKENMFDRSMSRLGQAKVLWHLGRRADSAAAIDAAFAELSHLSHPAARLLLDRRLDMERGDWSAVQI